MPPWQMWWPFTMSARTVMLSVALPGLMASSCMPRLRAAASRRHMAAAAASASAWGDRAAMSVMQDSPGERRALQARRNAVAVFAVAGGQMGQHLAHLRQANLLGP